MKRKITLSLIIVLFISIILFIGCTSNTPSVITGYRMSKMIYEGSGGYSESRTYQYDRNGYVTKEEYKNSEGYSESRTYQYDKNGYVTKEEYKNSEKYFEIFERKYDANGFLLEEKYKNSDKYEWIRIYKYDANGNLINDVYESKTDKYKSETKYEYDGNNNFIKYEFSDSTGYSENQVATYNEKGYAVKYDYSNSYGDTSTIEYIYDGDKLVKELFKSKYDSYTYNYSYDNKGNCTKTDYSDSYGNTYFVNYTYDDNNILRLIAEDYKSKEEGASYTARFEYNEKGYITKEEYNASQYAYKTVYEYDSADRMKKMEWVDLINNSKSTLTYEYDAEGNYVSSKEEYSDAQYSYTSISTYENGNIVKYEFKDSSNLTYSIIYTYDENGNLVKEEYRASTGDYYTMTYVYEPY